MDNQNYKLIPIEEYEHTNRNGFPCTNGWKYKLIQREEKTGHKAPFEWVKSQTKTFVKVKI
jgi:hypothetical protein